MVRITSQIALVGSGAFGLSHPHDGHVYLIESGGALALVDAGVGLEPERILANVRSLGHDPRLIRFLFLTHVHADHAGGTAALHGATGATVVAAQPELDLLARGTDEQLGLVAAKRNGTYPADYDYPHWQGGVAVEANPTFRLGAVEVRPIVTGGHSSASTCYLVEWSRYRALFAGDVVFAGGFISLINVDGSDLATYRVGLGKLAGLAVDGLYPGHGLFVVTGGQRHIDLARDRMGLSVIPNLAIAWLPPSPIGTPSP